MSLTSLGRLTQLQWPLKTGATPGAALHLLNQRTCMPKLSKEERCAPGSTALCLRFAIHTATVLEHLMYIAL